MTQPGYRHYIVLRDRTGSMAAIKEATEGGLRIFIEEQRKISGKATISLYDFDAFYPAGVATWYGEDAGNHVNVMAADQPGKEGMITYLLNPYAFLPLEDFPEEGYILDPRGNTPLWDAVGETAVREGAKLAVMPEDERPESVTYTIVTDGKNNWSSIWTPERVKFLLTEQQEKYAWKVTYLGANQNAWKVAGEMGIPQHSSMSYATTDSGTRSAWNAASVAVAAASSSGEDISYTDEQRKAAQE